MNIAILSDDLVIGRAEGIPGVEIPAELAAFPNARLRFDGSAIVDAGAITQWYVDRDGQKHIADGEGREPVECAADAPLIFENGAWRVGGFDDAKSAYKAAVDAAAERERLKHITGGAGQAMVYQQKVAEAARYVADGSPDMATYPLIAASIGVDGETAVAVAAKWQQMQILWVGIAAKIERARLIAKAQIDAASNDAAAARALAAYLAAPQGAV